MATVDIVQIQQYLDAIEKKLLEIPNLKKVRDTVGFKVVYLVIAALATFAILIYIFSGLRAITNLVAFVYPAWRSMKAVKSEKTDDDQIWLAYWVWYGLFTLIESITDVLFFWIPMYELLKMGFFVYLYALNGALFLYDKLLLPLVTILEKYENQAREKVGEFQKSSQNGGSAHSD